MRVACVQVALVDGEIEANRDRVLRMTEQALCCLLYTSDAADE